LDLYRGEKKEKEKMREKEKEERKTCLELWLE
jgi:hypothetical protein